jgi:hypothetical protein
MSVAHYMCAVSFLVLKDWNIILCIGELVVFVCLCTLHKLGSTYYMFHSIGWFSWTNNFFIKEYCNLICSLLTSNVKLKQKEFLLYMPIYPGTMCPENLSPADCSCRRCSCVHLMLPCLPTGASPGCVSEMERMLCQMLKNAEWSVLFGRSHGTVRDQLYGYLRYTTHFSSYIKFGIFNYLPLLAMVN